ncbi:MAG TPA: polysaccharide deacetylase family protein [Gemmatimonadales bacterium]
MRARLQPLRTAGAILCLHGVASPALPAQSVVHLPVPELEALLAAVRRMGQLVPLRDLVQRHIAGRSTAGLIAVTADDAYASLLVEAAELVRREAIPVTVFAVTQAAALGAQYWWDRIDDLFGRVPRERWRAFEDACGLPAAYRTGQPARFGPLRPLRQWLLAAHTGRWPQALEPLLQDLEVDAGTRTAQRSMTFEELARFAALPSVEVGVHTVSHPVLPLVPDAELDREITVAYETLREHLANVVPILAVPFGLFDHRTVMAARRAGMWTSLTLGGVTLGRHDIPDHLPRFCLSRDERPTKLQVRLTGLLDPGRWPWRRAGPPYPTLPSATT